MSRPDDRAPRQRRAGHAGDLAETTAQILVEGRGLRRRQARLRCVEIEQQQVLAVEPEGHRLEIRERPPEEAGGDEQQQRNRDLRHDQSLRQLDPRDAGEQAAARAAGRRILQRRQQSRTGGLKRRRQAEHDAAQHGQSKSDEEHTPVEVGVQRETLLSVREEAGQHADACHRDEDAKRAACSASTTLSVRS